MKRKPKVLADGSVRVELLKDEITVRIPSTRLTHATTGGLLPSKYHIEGRTVTLDMDRVKSCDSFGLAFLAVYVLKLLEWDPARLTIRATQREFGRHLNRMGVVDLLSGMDGRVRITTGQLLPNFLHLRGNNPRILELEKHTVDNEDDAEMLSDRLLNLVIERRLDLKPLTELLQTAL